MALNNKICFTTGDKINRWTILSESQYRDGKLVLWNVMCECGTKKLVAGSLIKSGKVKSCGCLQKEIASRLFQKPSGINGLNHFIYSYKQAAQKRNLSWNLTEENIKYLTKQNCFYCNIEPKQLSKPGSPTMTKKGIEHATYIYNGIDRIDNKTGYELNNCVPCCKNCNRAKRTMSQKEFFELVKQIYHHLNLQSFGVHDNLNKGNKI